MVKKIALSLVAIGLVSSLVGMASFALFSATANNASNTFTAGTVTLGGVTISSTNVGPMAPGDSSTINYSVTYTGNLDAYVGVKGVLTGDLAAPPNGLTATMAIAGSTVDTDGSTLVVHAMPGNTVAATITYTLPLAADNSYQGKTATYTVSAKAVQYRNNQGGNPALPAAWN